MAVVELTKENFEQVVTSNPMVVVDYWAPWCGPCRGFAPVFESVAEANPDVVFAKVNTDEEQEIAQHFQIRSIPTLMVFKEQVIVFSQAGALPKGPFEPSTVLPVQIYLWADSPERAFVAKTAAATIVLLGFLITMNALAVFLRKRFERRW